ncbi:hypothetical protein POSPLADRAFT_1147111 [Postia placenta MAD-698-R-SB12]|uniref:BUB1 N-terminal domain-containing protein n=1 Tax=Postia placenta MAD-698-R-SB12 TaxID=670580 RepID=A0A1X6MXB8_9APHY|nr:hypothetical protein POSPLADRAFT_1147111 [Postia placenta MAD-698-R-SB12]OSX61004.1 hypothetical protein POSPLADRAFT_1147111 [Postia placenta MAD-698-R-SB12]
MADVFDDTEPPIVDGDLLEAAKENIQPLAAGRRVTALSAILSTPHAQRESRLAAARTRLRINVDLALADPDDPDADPLDAYSRLVAWTVENYPQGHSAESGLLELLEEATRVLKDDRAGRWRADVRYLKLWVLYAGYVEKPAIIYKFCLVNEIGTAHALLYEEFATVLERAGRKAEADEAYLLGIARKAAPVERLQNKHREFQKRMMSSINAAAATTTPEPAAPSASSSSSTRRALAEASSSSSSSSSRTRASRTGSARTPGQLATPSPAPSVPRPNGRMQVFVDPSGADAENDPSAAAPWPELGTRKSRVKENVPEVRKAAGTTLRTAGRSSRAASGSRIPVYRDPEPGAAAEMPPPPVPSLASAPAPAAKKSALVVFRDEEDGADAPATPAFTPYRDEEPSSPTHAASATAMRPKAVGPHKNVLGLTEAEALRKDPFKNYEAGERPADE